MSTKDRSRALRQRGIRELDRGDLDTAVAMLTEAGVLLERFDGVGGLELAEADRMLAEALVARGDDEFARARYTRALERVQGVEQPEASLERARILRGMGLVQARKGAHAQAVDLLNESLARTMRALGEHDLEVALCENQLALSLKALARFPEARAAYRRALDILGQVDDGQELRSLVLANLAAVERKFDC